ncbi:MAG: metal ABC transporter substrate-binding protein [Actinobacteria bacterium]|nr:metal ABC transporter substrate-binding protein [Actinomycetota bacterium]
MTKMWVLVVLGLTSLGACAVDPGVEEGFHVVATTTILGDIVSQVVGDEATVEVIMPAGADPHEFQPSSAQIATLGNADLVVANGLGFEAGMAEALAALAADGARILEVAPHLDPVPFEEAHEHHEGEEGAAGEAAEDGEDQTLDPHFWLDPIRVAEAATLIAAELTDLEPDVDWAGPAEAYADLMMETHDEIGAHLADVEDRRLVTNHEAMGYFALRYDFEILGTVIPGGSTLGQPSSDELADLVEVLEHEGIRAIFADTSSPDDLARAIAAELGQDVVVVELYTESLGEGDAATVAGMLLVDARRIAEALTD